MQNTDSPSSPSLRRNSTDSSVKWVVQKFGGTSVGKFALQIARDIVPNYLEQNKVAVVCSARSGSTKATGTTNLLLRAASEALKRPAKPNGIARKGTTTRPSPSDTPTLSSSPTSPPRTPSYFLNLRPNAPFSDTIELLRMEHITAARSYITNPEILQELELEIENDCEWLYSFLFAARVIDEISPRSQDSIIGLGERMACKLVAAVLRDQGVDAEYVSLEDIVSDTEEVDGTLGQAFYDRVAQTVGERVFQCGAKVPVVTGFFGPVPGSLLTQVGRGYTDFLSALLAVGLGASELQIWKEVDGIFTADPRKVPTARLVSVISPDEAAELTYYGSEVVHPFTMEQVIRRKIPIRIKNVENPSGGGTVIDPDHNTDPSSPQPAPNSLQALHQLSIMEDVERSKRLPTAVTIKEHIVVLSVSSNRKSVSHGFLAKLFGTLDRYGVVVDLISTSEVHVSMCIDDSLSKRVLDRLVAELQQYGTVTLQREMAILSLVGHQMRQMVGISGRMFTTLGQGNVNIEMISQGANEINISCVINGRDAVKALNLIHQSCLLIKPIEGMGRVGPWLF